jgi:hypothetical protein
LDVGDDLVPIVRVLKHPGYAKQARSGPGRQVKLGPHGHIQDPWRARHVLRRHAPDAPKNADHPLSHKVALVRRHRHQGIERDRKVALTRGVNVDYLIEALRRDTVQEFLGGIAMGINKAQPPAGEYVLGHEISKERRLPRIGLTNDQQVIPSILLPQANQFLL